MSLPYVLVTNLAARRCTLSSAKIFLAVNGSQAAEAYDFLLALGKWVRGPVR